MNQKGSTNIVLIILIVILAGTTIYFASIKKAPETTQTAQTLETVNPGWKKYSDSSLSFEYPVLLSEKKEGETVSLTHSIDYKHPNSCDFKGDAPPLEKLTDFNISFKIVNQNLKSYVESSNHPGWDYVSQNPFTLGSFSGFKVSPGVEGCGQHLYYLTISPSKTLVITRPFVSELNSINGDYQKYLNLPGIIPPTQAEEFFTKIISSLKVN